MTKAMLRWRIRAAVMIAVIAGLNNEAPACGTSIGIATELSGDTGQWISGNLGPQRVHYVYDGLGRLIQRRGPTAMHCEGVVDLDSDEDQADKDYVTLHLNCTTAAGHAACDAADGQLERLRHDGGCAGTDQHHLPEGRLRGAVTTALAGSLVMSTGRGS